MYVLMFKLLFSIKGLLPKKLMYLIDADEYLVMEKNLRKGSVLPIPRPKIPVQVKIFSKDKLPKKLLTIQTLEDDDICCIAEHDGELIHYGFITFKNWNFWKYKIKFSCQSGSAYLSNIMTKQNYRGRGIASKVLETLLRYLQERGLIYVYVLISKDNYPSLKLFIKAGFKCLGEISCLKLFWLTTYNCKWKQPKKKEIGLIITQLV